MFRPAIATTLFLLLLHAFNADAQKTTLLVFTGSDWCPTCIRFEKKVLSHHDFNESSLSLFDLKIADFPQRKFLSAAEVKVNEQLAEQYNPEGTFPKILLLDATGRVLHQFMYRNETAAEFLQELKKHLQ